MTTYRVKVEEWTATTTGFKSTSTLIDEMEIELDYVVGPEQNIHFGGGFMLNLRPYRGNNAETLSLDYNLFKPGHPLNDDVVGVTRGTATISSGAEVFDYFNFYVNTSLTTKLRIRLEKVV